jgi:hypothetical protein
MKAIKTFILVAGIAATAHAQVVVTDPISDVLAEELHLEDIAKAVEMINNQVEQINALTQQLQQIRAYVTAFGDPAKLLSIIGADELIQSLQTSGIGQTMIELQQLADGLEALENNANGLYRSVGQTFRTPSGFDLPRAEELYRKFAAIDRAAGNFQSVFDDVLERRQILKGRIAATTEKLQTATTDAETQKLTGVLAGYNAELASIDQEIGQSVAEVIVQDVQNRADREKQEEARREERKAEFSEATQNYSKLFRIDPAPPAFPGRKP